MKSKEYYSALKRNELSSNDKTWRSLNRYYKEKDANQSCVLNNANYGILGKANYEESKTISHCQV